MANITTRPLGFPTSFFTETDPFKVMREMLRYDPFASLPSEYRANTYVPAFDVKETQDAYIFKADLPGVKEGDLEIQYQGNQLVVRGKREQEKEEKTDTYYAYERSYGAFARAFTLPSGVDTEHASAELKEGVLTVALPKKPEAQSKKIAISGAKTKN